MSIHPQTRVGQFCVYMAIIPTREFDENVKFELKTYKWDSDDDLPVPAKGTMHVYLGAMATITLLSRNESDREFVIAPIMPFFIA